MKKMFTQIVDDDFKNRDIISGDFRLIDLFKFPFCFDSNFVLDNVIDSPLGHPARKMILIEKKNVPQSLSIL